MINYEGMKAEANTSGYEMLPEGAYVAKVGNVKIEGNAPDQTLVLRLDVAEGEHEGYFMKRYKAESQGNGRFPAKYKGDFRLRIPNRNNHNDQWPETTLRRMNGAIWCFEKSNQDFHWDGDETKLVGKLVGINMQYGTYNDKPFTRIGRLESVEDVRNGAVKAMKHKEPAYSSDYQTGETSAPAGFTPVEDVDVPF